MYCNKPQNYSTIVGNSILKPVNNKFYWHVYNFTPDMPKYKVILAFTQAFQEWQVHFNPIQFVPTDDPNLAHIHIKFGNNNTPDLPVKFSNNTLAYAYAPIEPHTGIMWLNEDVTWSDMSKPDHILLKVVFMHELGHLFNFGHTDYPHDIMQPEYNPNNLITNDSVTLLRTLYADYINPYISYKELILKIFSSDIFLNKLHKKPLLQIANLLNLKLTSNYKKDILKQIINEIYN